MRLMLFYLLTGFAASCGQQGPLYLPEEEQPGSVASALSQPLEP